MAQIHFASDFQSAIRDGSSGNPFRDPSELPTPWRMTSGNEYLFRCDTETNFTAALRSASETAAPLVIGSWGSGAKPIITAYRMLDRSECVEVAVDNSGAPAVLTPQAGTNLWRVPKTFFGLFGGDVFGGATDVDGSRTSTKVMPSTARQWCGAVAGGVNGGYGVIYSVGNPVDTYGGVVVSSFDEGVWSTAAEQCLFATLRARGGLEIAELDLRRACRAAMSECGSTSSRYDLARHSFHNLRISDSYRGVIVSGDATYAPGVQYGSLRVHDNYAENMGVGIFDTAVADGTVLNDARIYRNVLNGFSHAMSWGGFYMNTVSTTDGSKILVELNTACNGDAGHFWPEDGYAFYQERDSFNIEFRRNFSWNCRRNYIALWGDGDAYFTQNVAIAPASHAVSESIFLTINSRNAGHNVYARGNVASGFVNFVGCTGFAGCKYSVLGNVSRGSGAGTYNQAINSSPAGVPLFTIDGNNFHTHGNATLRNWTSGTTYDSAPEVNNKITSDPSAELARLPVPTNPTVNYALQLSPNFWSGTVDLRPGTRVVT